MAYCQIFWYKNYTVSRPYRLMARTAPSHGVNRGSTPRRVTRANYVVTGEHIKSKSAFDILRVIIHFLPMETEMKRLYRSDRNRVFAGICGGLGEYWNIDPVLLRLIWLLVVIFTGVVPGLVAYIIGIFIIPRRTEHHRAH